jgi:multidrug resistance protein
MEEKGAAMAVAGSTVDGNVNRDAGASMAENVTSSSDTLTPANFKNPPAINERSTEEGVEINDENTVWWTSDDDPENPHNWPTWRKYSNSTLISLLTLITPIATNIFTPAIPDLMRYFKSTSMELPAFVVSVYVLGWAFGPLVFAPLSELYGRLPVYHVCNIIFVIFTLACAMAPTLESLIVFRFFAGCFGSAPMANGGGSIADMFPPEQRAAMMAAFSIGPLLGPIIGPAVGGVLAQNKGWRWTFWLVAIMGGAVSVAMVLVMRESYAPVILDRRTKRLRRETGNQQLRSKLDQGLTSRQLFKLSIVRPMKLLIFSPICTVFAVYAIVVYGFQYLVGTSIPFVFKDTYGFSSTEAGLAFLGGGIGCFLGMIWFGVDSTMAMKRTKEQNSESEAEPEVRLRLLPAGAIIYPAGFFIYGWTTHFQTHWLGPIVGLFVNGVGRS